MGFAETLLFSIDDFTKTLNLNHSKSTIRHPAKFKIEIHSQIKRKICQKRASGGMQY